MKRILWIVAIYGITLSSAMAQLPDSGGIYCVSAPESPPCDDGCPPACSNVGGDGGQE